MVQKLTCEELEQRIQELEQAESKHKQLEEALQDTRNMLQTVLDSIPSKVFWKDRDLNYLGGNCTWLETSRLKSVEEVVGKNDYDLSWEKGQADLFRKVDRKVLESGIPEYNIIEPYLRFDGLQAWARTNKVPLRDKDGNIIGVLGTFEDITEQKKMEKALQDSEKKYRSMMNSMKDAAYICSPELYIEYMNPAMIDRIGRDATGELCHKAIYDRDKKCSWCVFDQVQQGKDVEYEVADPKNNSYCSVTNSPILHADSAASKITIFHDITSQKKNEIIMNKINESLGKKVKERTSALEDLNTALRVLLKKREEDKNQIGKNIYANFKSLIQPLLNQLKNRLITNTQEDILDILESSIKEMATSFSKKLADPIVGLTPTEIQVAALVKDGKTNKEIAQILNKSIRAITSHRDNIRLKLGLKNKKINLRSYLLSLD